MPSDEFLKALDVLIAKVNLFPDASHNRYVDEARERVVALYEAAVKDAERGRWFVNNLRARSLHMDGTAEYSMQPEGRNFRRAASREEAVDRAIAEERAWRESPDNPYRESSS